MAFRTFRDHGTPAGYNAGCSCDLCREAHRDRLAKARASMRARGLPPGDPRHGKSSSYKNWSCRCLPCTKAHSAELKRRRDRKRELTS